MDFFKDAWNKVGYKYLSAFTLAGLVFSVAVGEFRATLGIIILYILW
jgi:hypothetical protein